MDRIPQPLDHQLTDDQLKMIGLISVNWGSLERLLRSTAIMLDPDLLEQEASGISFHYKNGIDVSIKRLRKLSNNFSDKRTATAIIAEIDQCYKAYRDMRNVIIHGAAFLNISDEKNSCRLRFKMGDGREVGVDQIGLLVEQSKYLLMAALNLHCLGHGLEHGLQLMQMPPRPPVFA